MKILNLKVPLEFRPFVRKAKRLLLNEYKDTRGIILIGSIADKTYNKSSDIDIAWIKSRKLNFDRRLKIEKKLNSYNCRKVQLVPFSAKKILWHFNFSSTMAHSIQQGILFYGKKDKLISELLSKELSTPKKEWMRYWFNHWIGIYKLAKDSIKREKKFHKKYCKGKCICSVFDDIARVAVNFAILYIETRNSTPTSKQQVLKNIKKPSLGLSKNLLEGVKLALKFSGKDKYLTLTQADKILISTNWLEKRLKRCIS